MTVREFFQTELEGRGLFDHQAKAVVDLHVTTKLDEYMASKIDTPASGYPPVALNVLLFALFLTAVEWIDREVPMHWARACFIPQDGAS